MAPFTIWSNRYWVVSAPSGTVRCPSLINSVTNWSGCRPVFRLNRLSGMPYSTASFALAKNRRNSGLAGLMPPARRTASASVRTGLRRSRFFGRGFGRAAGSGTSGDGSGGFGTVAPAARSNSFAPARSARAAPATAPAASLSGLSASHRPIRSARSAASSTFADSHASTPGFGCGSRFIIRACHSGEPGASCSTGADRPRAKATSVSTIPCRLSRCPPQLAPTAARTLRNCSTVSDGNSSANSS